MEKLCKICENKNVKDMWKKCERLKNCEKFAEDVKGEKLKAFGSWGRSVKNLLKTYGKIVENLWKNCQRLKTCEKYVEKMLKSYGNVKTCGKL